MSHQSQFPQLFDFTVSRRTDRSDEPTNLVVDPASRGQILSIPKLSSCRVYSEFAGLSSFITANTTLTSPAGYWFVSYSLESDPLIFGPGHLMIIERGSGSIVYKGSDFGE